MAALGICFFSFLSCFCPLIFADTVTLKSGQVIEGRIIENTPKFVQVDFDGVKLTYFQEEVASIQQGDLDNLARKEVASLYEAFKANKKSVEDTKFPASPSGLAESAVNQKAQDTVNVNSILLSKTPGGVNPSAAMQEALSQLPKEYQDLVKANLQNVQGAGTPGQVPGAIGGSLSSLPPEYQNLLKSSLEKMRANPPETKK